MPLRLNSIPGFSGVDDSVLANGQPARGIHVEEISANAAFAMARTEVFQAMYKNGDTVPLPQSPIDGYIYSRAELLYLWNPAVSTDPATGWIQSGSGSLFFCNWDVDQATGEVFSLEWYRNNGSGGSRTQTNDGQIQVFTIAQRQRQNIFMPAVPTFSTINPADIATDKPWKQALSQGLNDNAKFAVTNKEVFYCGEFTNGTQIPLSAMVSPADGYAYSYAEAKFIACWRWTTDGSVFQEPPEQYGQMGPFICSIDSTGHVATQVITNDNDGNVTFPANYGRIAAFAFCTRSATPGSAPLANSFQEVDESFFVPGNSLRASNVLAVKKNIDEAILTPEFFGPTVYANGDTIPLPVSPVDGYTYARNELVYIWCWSDTHNFPPNGGRLPVFYGGIDPATGVVNLACWRLASHYVDDHNELCRMTVIVVARRQAAAPELINTSSSINAPSDIATATVGTLLTKEIAIPSTTRGDFSIAHGLPVTPISAYIQNETNGVIRFQTTRYDGTNVYLNASADGLTGHVFLFYLN